MTLLTVLVILPLLFCASSSTCQELERPHDVTERDGRTALIFTIDELNLESFNGGIGVKHWLSDASALVGSFDVGYIRLDAARESEQLSIWSDQKTYTVGVSAEIQRHIGHSRLSPYVGGGLSYAARFEDLDGSTTKADRNAHAVGGKITMGAEYWFSDHFAVAGAYDLGVTYERREDERYVHGSLIEKNEKDAISVAVGAGRLMLSVYF